MDFIQGTTITLFAAFYDGLGEPIINGVSGTNVTIYNFIGNTPIFEVISGIMTQQSPPLENIWYYNYSLANNSVVGTYNVVYNAMLSGLNVQTTESFSVLPAASSFPNPFGQGSVAVSGIVVDISGNGIFGASIVVSSGMTTFASATSDPSGNYVAYLNPGVYLFNYFANGYYPTQTVDTIPSGTNWLLTPQVMQYSSQGSLVISDTFAFQYNYNGMYPNTAPTYPIPNLKIVLNNKADSADAPPYGIAYTNQSGTFVMTADPGFYVMTVKGEYWNMNTNRNDRFNSTYDIEVNPIWSGSGPNGNMPPFNFQYQDTSKYNFIG